MTRREYLTALNQYLVTMSESEKMSILTEYDNHFRKGFEAGKTEAQISASLGSPYDVANEFLEGRRPKVPTYPPKPRPQTSSDSSYIGQRSHTSQPHPQTAAQPRPQTAAQPRPQTTVQPRPQTAAQPRPQTAAQPRPQTQQTIFTEPTYPQTQQTIFTEPTYPQAQQTIFTEPTYPQAQQPIFTEPTYPQAQQPIFTEPTYPRTQQQAYSEPAYTPTPRPQAYSAPAYPTQAESQYAARPQNNSAYVDYDRAAEEKPMKEKKKRESEYSTTGIIVVSVICVVLAVVLVPSVYYLIRGIYELIRAFPGTGVALIVAGGSLSANNLWICLGLIFIGISFLALTGLLVMAIIEITRLAIKLFRYVYKECKKMVKEGSF